MLLCFNHVNIIVIITTSLNYVSGDSIDIKKTFFVFFLSCFNFKKIFFIFGMIFIIKNISINVCQSSVFMILVSCAICCIALPFNYMFTVDKQCSK